MNKKLTTANIILATALCCVPGSTEAKNNADASTVQTTAESDRTAVSLRSVMDDIKAAAPADVAEDYTPEQILELWKALQPELTDEIIRRYGEENVLRFIGLVLDFISGSDTPGELPDISDLLKNETLQKYLDEFKIFLTQVVPLYSYQTEGRITPQAADSGMFAEKNVYTTPKDGCFYGVGDGRNTYDPLGIDCEECRQSGGKPKANGSYVWGMVNDGERLYWSTNNNYLCAQGYGQIATMGGTGAVENSCWVCEYDKGQRAKELAAENPALAKYGDIVPPRIFSYDPKTGVVADITPDDNSLKYSQGLRSAAYHHGVVFFGGPNFTGGADSQQSSSSTFLAYSPEKGKFIGSSDMSSVSGCTITNVRRWIVVDDVLYCGVGMIRNGQQCGGILRWNGSADDPFNFEVVGYTPAEAAEIEYHKGHIYVGGWPIAKFGQKQQVASALYKSPEVPKGGFTAENATEWQKVWEYTSYETNPTAYGNTYFSVMKSFKGKLYWGMFSGTYSALYLAQRKFGTIKSAEAIAYVLGSLRATTLFAADDVTGNNADVELLYGESELPVYNADTKTWTISSNGSNYVPKWGRSGYGNLFTCYTWSMAKYNDKLFIGTMDMSDLIDPALEGMEEMVSGNEDAGMLDVLKNLLGVDKEKYGFECIMVEDHDKEPVYVTDNGFGNPAAYAVRNIEVLDGKLFLGTANPLNLHEQGGWQILSVEENKGAASVSQAEVKPAGIMYRQHEEYLEFSSLKGEKIQSVSLTDLSGKTIVDDAYGRTLATVITSGIAKGVYVASIRTESDSYSMKVTIK